MEAVKRTHRPYQLLFLFFASLIGLIYLLLNLPPGSSFTFYSLHISYLIFFFVLLFLCIYSVLAFFFRSALQGILVASVVECFLLFRLFNLTHPFFAIVLLILFLCVEGIVWKKK